MAGYSRHFPGVGWFVLVYFVLLSGQAQSPTAVHLPRSRHDAIARNTGIDGTRSSTFTTRQHNIHIVTSTTGRMLDESGGGFVGDFSGRRLTL